MARKPSPGVEVWQYNTNERVHCTLETLPPDFQTTGTIRGDYIKLAEEVGVRGFHPAFKPQRVKGKLGRGSAGAGVADGDAAPLEEHSVFTVNTMQFDRISAHILGLILPETRHLKVLRFVDCRLNLEMIRLLRVGLTGNCSVECLQVEFNPLDVDWVAQASARLPSSRIPHAAPSPRPVDKKEDEEESSDPAGLVLASFADPEVPSPCVLECLSVRACNVSQLQLQPLAAALRKCPWQLRQLNLWENLIDDAAAASLAKAFDEYRGLEYLGLGRNRITDRGMKALLAPFNAEILDEAGAKQASDSIKEKRAEWDAKEKAKAKAKAKPKASPGARRIREPTVYTCSHDVVEERPPEGSDAGSSWILRKYSELKALSLMENAIKSEVETAELQRRLLRPRAEGDPKKPVELVLVGTPLAAALLQKNPDLKPQDKKAFVFPPAGPDASDGWAIRLV